jgi:c-di-GMP-binding flagellar brake protein YcgR
MLLESLNALILAGNYALQVTCGLSVTAHKLSLVRQGSLTFPALGELRIKGAPLQQVHLGCDALLWGQLVALAEEHAEESGIEALTESFLKQLLQGLEARNPRGQIHSLDISPVNLTSRGVRSFGIRLETGVGQLFVLVEVPSRMELENAKGSGFAAAMESTFLPRDWGNRQVLATQLAIDNFLVFLRKVEGDVYFEIPGDNEGHVLYSGVLLDNGTYNGVRGLKFCTDLTVANEAELKTGDLVRASVGVEDRSLQFGMAYLGQGTHRLVSGAELPCAFFLPPEEVTITQRRLAFRIPVPSEIPVELRCGNGPNGVSPWADQSAEEATIFRGTLSDLSFSGACVVAESSLAGSGLDINRRVVCDIHFPEGDAPLSVLGVVRRTNSRLIARNERRHEIGLEFLILGDGDRAALDHIRQFVLAEQRTRLSQRIHVTGITT